MSTPLASTRVRESLDRALLAMDITIANKHYDSTVQLSTTVVAVAEALAHLIAAEAAAASYTTIEAELGEPEEPWQDP